MTAPAVALPPQPVGVAWPTSEWPTGALSAARAGEVAELLDAAFSSSSELGRTLAVLIVQGGRLVEERYGEDTTVDSQLISWSMAKSITHAAVGLLVADGAVDVDSPLPAPEWTDDPDRRAITWGDLLAMRSGLHWIEDYEDPGISTCLEMLFGDAKEDMGHYAASQPLDHRVGSTFVYSSGTTNIIARAIRDIVRTQGSTMPNWLEHRLFRPLGIRDAEPGFDGAGTFVGSSYVWTTARNFARFGLLYLRDGIWDGDRLLPEGWVDDARMLRSVDEDGAGYGRHWWVERSSRHGTFRANGYEGQSISVVPAGDVIVIRLGKTPAEYSDNLTEWRARLIDAIVGDEAEGSPAPLA